MAKAHYQIHVPNEARRVAFAAHQYLCEAPVRGINAATVQLGHPHDTISIIGDESPELDSHIKQTAAFIGDVANAPVINAMKQGKNIAHWPIRNPNYQAPVVQAPVALSPQVAEGPMLR